MAYTIDLRVKGKHRYFYEITMCWCNWGFGRTIESYPWSTIGF